MVAAFEVQSDITLVLPELQIARRDTLDRRSHIPYKDMDLYLDPYIFMCHLHFAFRLMNEVEAPLSHTCADKAGALQRTCAHSGGLCDFVCTADCGSTTVSWWL